MAGRGPGDRRHEPRAGGRCRRPRARLMPKLRDHLPALFRAGTHDRGARAGVVADGLGRSAARRRRGFARRRRLVASPRRDVNAADRAALKRPVLRDQRHQRPYPRRRRTPSVARDRRRTPRRAARRATRHRRRGASALALGLSRVTRRISSEHRRAAWLGDIGSEIAAARHALTRPSWRLLGAFGYLLFDIAVLWTTFAAVGPLLARCWPAVGPLLARCWPAGAAGAAGARVSGGLSRQRDPCPRRRRGPRRRPRRRPRTLRIARDPD